MRKVWIGIALAAVALVGFGVIEIGRGSRSLFTGFDRGMQAKYEKISMGDSQQTAVESLGKPLAESDAFNLPQRHGFEHYFDAAEKSSAVKYFLWVNGTNWYYCIGFNSAGEVVIKGEGHS